MNRDPAAGASASGRGAPAIALGSFLPRHRRRAVAEGRQMPDRVRGAALFADISGFTPLTEALVAQFGPHRGAEELDTNLNRVYQAIIDDLARYDGEVLYFSGDAITCWLDGDDGSAALQVALQMQATIREVGIIEMAQGSVELSIKVAVVVGEARRFAAGDPDVQVLDILGGRIIDHVAAAEGLAERGDIIADESVLDALGDRVVCADIRIDLDVGRRCAVVTGLVDGPAGHEPRPLADLTPEQAKPWLLPFVQERIASGGGRFLGELRRSHSIFVRFGGFDFDHDDDVGRAVDEFLRAVQRVLARYEGTLLGITVGDKGAYLNAVVGTPVSHEDDARRAVAAAIEIRDLEATTAAVGLQVGVAAGLSFSGTYGHTDRQTFSVLGDATNLSARLMGKAPPGEVYVHADVAEAAGAHFVWGDLPPLTLKGKARPVEAKAAVAARRRSARRTLRYPLPMVGRDQELNVVGDAAEAALAGDRRVVSIGAEAGMGKSRFVADVLARARDMGHAVAYGQAEAIGRTTSYLAWREPWRRLFGLEEDRSEAEQVHDLELAVRRIDPGLVPRLPLLGPVVGLDIADNDFVRPFDAKLRKTSLENLLADVLLRRLATTPLLIVLEDLQWIDPLSAELLEVLVRVTAGHRALFLVSYRIEGETNALPALRGVDADHELVLGDLDEAGMREVVAAKTRQVFGDAARCSDSLVDLVLGRAQGNPFYAEELVNYVRRLGLDPADPDTVDELDLPDSLQAIVLSRIDALDEHPRQGLKVASVIGREFEAPMLGRVHEALGDPDRVLAHLERARAVDLLVPEDDELVDWLFRHAITRDVAYESIPFGIRRALHERIGDELAADGRGSAVLDTLAHHYWHSENLDKQQRYLRLAGDAARDAYANEAAIQHYERLTTVADGGERAAALLDLAAVLELVGRWDDAETAATEARSLAEGVGDQVRVGWCDVQLGEIARRHGRYDEAVELLRRARVTFEANGEEAGQARVGHLRGTVAAQQGDLVEARRQYERSRSIRDRNGDVVGLAAVLTNLGIVAEYEGDFRESLAFHQRALELRQSSGDRWALANSYTNLGMIAMYERRHRDARELFEQAMQLNAEIGDAWSVALAHHNLGNAQRELDEADVARRHYAQALEAFRAYDDRWSLAFLVEDVARLAVSTEPVLALELLGAADHLRAEIDAARPAALEEELAAAMATGLAGLTPDAQTSARTTGRRRPDAASLDLAGQYCTVTAGAHGA